MLAQVWARRGFRPTPIHQAEYESLYCFIGSVSFWQAEGMAEGMIAPHLNIDAMNPFFKQLTSHMPSSEHAKGTAN